jgi:predicted deacetylase
MNILVSIHDVSPAFADGIFALWNLCASHGVTPALLVVPEWHGQWPVEANRAFAAWLRDCADRGAEILLHGERHDEDGLPRGWRDELRAAGRTAREGECLTLRGAAARAHVERGLTRLRALGLNPVGFVPPAWLAREDTHNAVAALGLRVSEDTAVVRVHHRQVRIAAPAIRWSSRSAVRALGSVLVARWRWHTLRRTPLVRLTLHPQDLTAAVTARSVASELVRWTAARSAIRYADL